MKEIATAYLRTKIEKGVDLFSIATETRIFVFHIADFLDFVERKGDLILRKHDGIRLVPFHDSPRKIEIMGLYRKAIAIIPSTYTTAFACEEAIANYFGGKVTGGCTDCPWDIELPDGRKLESKGIGGGMEQG